MAQFTTDQLEEMSSYERFQVLRYGNIVQEYQWIFGANDEIENGDQGQGCIVEGHTNLITT